MKKNILLIFLFIFLAFKLSAQRETFIDYDSNWKLNNADLVHAKNWRKLNFPDNYWPENTAKLGFELDVRSGELSHKNLTCYLRKKFTIKDTTNINHVGLDLIYDDGIVVYLNEEEVFRENLFSNIVSFDDFGEKEYFLGHKRFCKILPSKLNIGKNVVAVELLNYRSENRDLNFDLQLYGYYFNKHVIIQEGAKWQYLDEGLPEENWTLQMSDSKNWKQGYAKFGYGDGRETTLVSYGENKKSKRITTYFRKAFKISDPEEYLAYSIRLLRDDGAVIYLNGNEILRTNMPEGIISDTTKAEFIVTGKQEAAYHYQVIDSDLFYKGTNRIAVSLHQIGPETSDCGFDLELLGVNDPKSIHNLLKTKDKLSGAKLEDIENKFDLRNKELEIKILNIELGFQRLFIAIGILFIVAISVYTYRLWGNVRKRTSKYDSEFIYLKNNLENKNRELLNLALNQVQKNRLLKEIETDLSEAEINSFQLNKSFLNRLKTKLGRCSEEDNEWQKLQLHFDNVHSEFFIRLKKEFPSLTESELRHCGYIKLHLSTKEIAKMLSIDPRSVQVGRYRIKKKMNLPEEVDLKNFIAEYV